MHRGLFTLCSAVSLLLCVAVCVLWVRGRHQRDVLTLKLGEHRVLWVETVQDGGFEFVQQTGAPSGVFQSGWITAEPTGPLPASTRHGFGAVSTTLPVSYDGGQSATVIGLTAVTIPTYMLALLTALLPTVWISIAWRQERVRNRTKRGLCPRCGYDLRASPERYPECGAAVVAPAVG